jgi:hypothetical protein
LHLNQLHRKKYIVFYLLCFLVSYCWLFFNNSLLSQLQPVFFTNRLDFSLTLLQSTGLHFILINSKTGKVFFDLLYIFLPILLAFFCLKNYTAQYFIAITTSVFNLIYALEISSLSTLSVEGFIGWMLLPLLFAFKSAKAFYYALHSLRYIFLLLFFSAGIWKIRAGGVFNIEQMSAILATQHGAYLTSATKDWFTALLKFLISHSKLSYLIYLIATIVELFYIVGFFTKKFDKILILLFLLFLVFNFTIMRINYFTWVAFLGCLWLSKYDEPK